MAPKVEYKYQYTLYASNTIFILCPDYSSIILTIIPGIIFIIA